MSHAATNVAEAATRSSSPRWRVPRLQLVAALVLILGAGVALYPQTAAWFSQKSQSLVISQGTLQQPDRALEVERQTKLQDGHRYNDALASGAVLEANSNLPAGDGLSSDDSLVYDELLTTSIPGMMGRLMYSALEIDLPVYHGTSDETLLKGVGHLEGTSLPVGGLDSRSVLTAHRGLANATMFTNLDKAEVGHLFSVELQGQVLTYRVNEIRVVEPDETEALRAVPGQDLMTLVTCTPLGINTQRILVTGERILPTPAAEVAAAQEEPEIPGFPWWAVIFSATVVGSAGYVWWSGYPAEPRRSRD